VNILVVSPLLPLPAIDGGRRGVFYSVKSLASRGHRIHFACLNRQADPDAVKAMERYCTVDLVPATTKPNVVGATRALFSRIPYDASRFHNEELLARILDRLQHEEFDVVQIYGIHAAWYARKIRRAVRLPIVLRVECVQYLNLVRALGRYRNPFLNLYLRLEAAKMRRYEAEIGKEVDINLTVTGADRDALHSLDPSIPCAVVPSGIDPHEFVPGTGPPAPWSVLWMGSLSWLPNQDSFWWFYREIVPLLVEKIPDVSISIAGSNPPDDILAIKHPNIRMLGFVPDLQECMRQNMVCVVPLRVGSGLRIKLLEMFAMKKAVVSTPVGCEGLDVTDGKELLVAETPVAFADAVARLLADSPLRESIAGGGRAFVLRGYTWDRIAEQWEGVLRSTIQRYRTRTEGPPT
jgi:polysaccharide biosynthesis protein PslH